MSNLNEIKNASNIADLLEALNDYEGDQKLSEAVDMSSLPTFGKEPESTLEVFSWDEECLLVQGEGRFELVEREDNFNAQELYDAADRCESIMSTEIDSARLAVMYAVQGAEQNNEMHDVEWSDYSGRVLSETFLEGTGFENNANVINYLDEIVKIKS